MSLRVYVEAVLFEWRKGCSVGPAGECLECSSGALVAIEEVLLRERSMR